MHFLVAIIHLILISFGLSEIALQPNKISSMWKSVVEMTKALNIENNRTVTIIRPSKAIFDSSEGISVIAIELKEKFALEIFDMDDKNLFSKSFMNIVIIDKTEQFHPIPDFYDKNLLNFRSYLIVAFDNYSKERKSDVKAMMEYLWTRNVTNVNFLVHGMNEYEIDVLTGFPFQHDHGCQGIKMMKINTFKEPQFTEDNFFLDKFTDLGGCSLYFIALTARPKSSFYNEDVGRKFGIDVSLLEGKRSIDFNFILLSDSRQFDQ